MVNRYKLLLLLVCAVLLFSCKKDDNGIKQSNLQTIEYTELDEVIFNPERGFYSFNEFRSNSNGLSEGSLKHLTDNGQSILYTAYTMPDFRDKLIPESYLDLIRHNMERLRENGVKCVLRFRYTTSQNDTPWDPTEELVMQHIAQIKPILQEYADVILVLEAGFIGVWGEWYYTDNFINRPTPEEYGPRKRVLDALLDALPKRRMVCVRYPAAKIYSFEISHTDTVTLQTAYNESDLSRVAFHNDCFLADQDDRGTFGGNRFFRQFWQQETKYLAMGGETCGISSFSSCDNAISDMEKYHWSFLNSSYHPGVIGQWNANKCMDEIKKRLGYRFVLNKVEHTRKPNISDKFEINIHLKNHGFAAPFNPRLVELVFISTSSGAEYKTKLDADPRYWFADNEISIEKLINLPSNMEAGEYKVCLNIPDPEPTLYDNKLFSIRLANENTWDDDKGYNVLTTLNFE